MTVVSTLIHIDFTDEYLVAIFVDVVHVYVVILFFLFFFSISFFTKANDSLW